MLTKPRQPGSAHETLGLMVEQAGGVKRVADFEDIKPSTVYKLLDPDQEGEYSFARVCRIVAHFGADAPAQLLASLAGGTYLPIPRTGDSRFADLTAESLLHIGQVSHDIIAAHSPKSDGGRDLTAREARQLLKPLGELLLDVSHLIALARRVADGEAQS